MIGKRIPLFILFLTSLMFTCSAQERVSGNYSHESECIGVGDDGSQMVKVWATGLNKKEIIEHAKKIAIKDVLFKGIRKGKSDCSVIPLIVEVNAQEKYEDYFYDFFADQDVYSQFAIVDMKHSKLKMFSRGYTRKGRFSYGVIVSVLKYKLKRQLIKDQILKR